MDRVVVSKFIFEQLSKGWYLEQTWKEMGNGEHLVTPTDTVALL